MDCIDTLIVMRRENELRPGVPDFVKDCYHDGKKLAVSSDWDSNNIKESLKRFGIDHYFSGIYDYKSMIWFREDLLKDLSKVCDDFNVDPSRAVMVGDNLGFVDQKSAEKAGTGFVYVPNRFIDPKFTFDSIPRERRYLAVSD
jgi:FMN phosphatase YigB (HAD superfamily)